MGRLGSSPLSEPSPSAESALAIEQHAFLVVLGSPNSGSLDDSTLNKKAICELSQDCQDRQLFAAVRPPALTLHKGHMCGIHRTGSAFIDVWRPCLVMLSASVELGTGMNNVLPGLDFVSACVDLAF